MTASALLEGAHVQVCVTVLQDIDKYPYKKNLLTLLIIKNGCLPISKPCCWVGDGRNPSKSIFSANISAGVVMDLVKLMDPIKQLLVDYYYCC